LPDYVEITNPYVAHKVVTVGGTALDEYAALLLMGV